VELDGAASPGQSQTINNVPTGACTFDEQDLTEVTNWTWGDPVYAPDPATVTVSTGETAEAIVTNTITRNTAQLALVKKVDGGTADETDWNLSATAGSPDDGYNFDTDTEGIGQGTFQTVYAGTEYTLAEEGGIPGYVDGDWVCLPFEDPQEEDARLADVAEGPSELNDGDSITLAKDAKVVCTITNTALPGEITVIKTDADNGAPLAGALFQLWLDANANGAGDEGEEIGDPQTTGADGVAKWGDLEWGTYLVEEVDPPDGYALSVPAIREVVINSDTFNTATKTAFVLSESEGTATVAGYADSDNEYNKVAYWCPDGGTKLEGGFDEGGYSYTLDGAYAQVIVKASAGQYSNTIFNNPSSGQFVWADTNGDGDYNPGGQDGDKEISHIILCGTPDVPQDGEVSLIFANPRLPGSIEVVKKDDAGALLAGVTFELFADANDNDIVDLGESLGQDTTTETGTLTWGGLEWRDDYKVIEVSWPTGYVPSGELVTGPYTIKADTLSVTVNRVNNRIDIPKLDKTSVPAEPTAVEAGNTITYTILVKNEGALPLTNQTLVDTLPTGVTLNTSTVTPAGDTSKTGEITWKFDLGAFSQKEFTYTVNVTAGFGSPNLVNTATWVEKKLTDKTEHPVKALKATVESFCVIDAPYYRVKITPQNGNLFNSQDVTVRWYQANAAGQPIDAKGAPTTDPAQFVPAYNPDVLPTGSAPYVDSYSLTDSTDFTVQDGTYVTPDLLWKGAAIDPVTKSATKWPGWVEDSPGVWRQVDSGGVRPGMFAVITVNPTAQTVAIYPPAAAPCANPPGVPLLDKTADPDEGTEVGIGETIEYTVTVKNTGGSAFTGPMVDTLPAGFDVDEASVTASGGALSGNTITWQVTLEAQASTTLTYSGIVTDAAFGDLVNTVVLTLPKGTISDSTVHPVAVVAEIEDEIVAAEEEELADTGANNVGNLVGAALLAMLAGGLMVTFGRRRREE
jgi:uncharacterized repeat protein (TIGR01451 family)